ncbi:MAG: DNA-directed RNA polymerase subunit alpha [Leptospiraceae bacterium]|nr:DNA-directed RNA polymerase subunit alpha [Leptospiraceae bacterium]MDW7975197.1 DNA-directed RNA polymerase subunit alpha [Leptospiraceae bacterium]
MRFLIRPLKKPKSIQYETIENQPNYGKFVIEPFERGFAVTIGNALRRTLLSSIEGSAITAVKIQGVEHEFSTIPGVLEDVTRIILNLKRVRLIYDTEKKDEAKILHIEKHGAGVLTAGDLAVDSAIQILNPDLVIATLNEDADLIMDIQVERGRGYVPAELIKKNSEVIGTIAVDALFSPIQKVNFTVEETRKDSRSDLERLILEIWTDSSIKPKDALSQAAKILRDNLAVFVNLQDVQEDEEEAEHPAIEESLKNNLEKHVEELEFSVRTLSLLKSLEIEFVIDLVKRMEDEFQKSKHYSKECIEEIKEKLSALNLELGMKDIPYIRET